ncbi:MAG: TIGR02186 family protein [Nitrospirae bacterium]|nr:TIGR02186 family protein [Nitrospirota bacterium]
MNFKFQIFKFSITLPSILTALMLFSGNTFAGLTIKANHDNIKIDFFYHGSTVSVKGASDPGVDLIIKITSPDGHEVLKQKGKAAGFLWMNTGTLNFEHTPNLYSLHSTKKLEDILSREEAEKYIIGYSALNRHIEIKPVNNESEKATWFKEFIRFKESSKLYAASAGKIAVTLKDGRQEYYILTDWPYQAPPGDYFVTVHAVKDKKVIETAEANVHVEQVGSVKLLAQMAENSAATYGIISILIAVAAGFGVGLIFKKGGAH